MNKNKNHQLGLGTASIGRPLYINIKQENTSGDFSKQKFINNAINTLNVAYKQGIRYFDTAPGYGMAEEILIDWLKDKDDPSIEVATKWGYTYVANFDPNATQHEIKEHSLEKLKEQWEQSKALLPFLKIYQIHSATLETGVLDNQAILHHLAELKKEYAINIGITTTGANQLQVLKKALDIEIDGEELFDVFQVTYNIFDQSLASMAEDMSKRNKRLIIKEAMANGRIFPNTQYPNYAKAYKYLKELSLKYKVGVDAIALRFCMDSIPAYQVLSGAAIELHVLENRKALDFKLEEEDLLILKELAIKAVAYWSERKELDWN